ncbi:hypothetical protein ABBQ32_011498 [Trebouxia sp. C0010 RCD-2024]
MPSVASPIRLASTLEKSSDSPGAAAKLSHVAEKFSTFYSEIENERQARRHQEASRHQQAQESLSHLEAFVKAQAQKQQEANAQLKAYIDDEIRAVHERISAQIRDSQLGLKACVDSLARNVQDLKDAMRDERVQRISDVEYISQAVRAKAEECLAAVDDERVARLEKEAQSLKRVSEEVFRVQKQIDSEKLARESASGQLQSDLQQLLNGRHVIDEKFQALVLDEIAGIKTEVQAEKEERISEDEQIVGAINEYTRALQDGLRIVSS